MRIDNTEAYYRENAADLGWGPETARLDPERVELLTRYVIGPRVLDVACGSGIYTDYLASKGYDVWGIDLVGEFIEKAKKCRKGTFLQGEAERLPFADGEFDTVLLFDILEHVDDVALLREAKRVASKRIIVNVPRKVDRELELGGLAFGHYVDKSHLREYTTESIQMLGQQLGLTLEYHEEINALSPKDLFKILFRGNRLVKRVMSVLAILMLRSAYFYTNIIAVFKKY